MSNAMPKEKALHPEENKAVKAFAGIVDRGGMRCDSPALAPAADPFEEAKEADPFEHHDDGSKSFETPWGRKCFVSGAGVEFTARGSTDRVKVCGPLEVVAEVRSDAGDDRRLLLRGPLAPSAVEVHGIQMEQGDAMVLRETLRQCGLPAAAVPQDRYPHVCPSCLSDDGATRKTPHHPKPCRQQKSSSAVRGRPSRYLSTFRNLTVPPPSKSSPP